MTIPSVPLAIIVSGLKFGYTDQVFEGNEMFHRVMTTTALVAALFLGSTAAADDTEAEVLFEALALPDIIAIMRDEGIAYGGQIGDDMFPSQNGSTWSAKVKEIYDGERMTSAVKTAFVASLEGDDVASMISFFSSDIGRSFVNLEVSARRALLDEAVEAASKEMAAIARTDATPRFALVDTFVQTNALIETNVVGALNSNYSFYKGLMEGGAFDEAMTEDQILADVWEQENDIRANTTEWIFSFLLLAYDPVEDRDLQAYIDFSKSEAGRQLNSTLFAAFDDYFDLISYNLGFEAARMMSGSEL